MGYVLAFYLCYVVGFWAVLLEHGKCQVLNHSLFSFFFGFGLFNTNEGKLKSVKATSPYQFCII